MKRLARATLERLTLLAPNWSRAEHAQDVGEATAFHAGEIAAHLPPADRTYAALELGSQLSAGLNSPCQCPACRRAWGKA